MTSQKKPLTDGQQPLAPELGDDARPASTHIQQNLPAIARVVVALALQGNVSAASLCFRVGNPSVSLEALVQHGLARLSPDLIDELALVLADAGCLTADGHLIPTPADSCGTMPEDR